MQYVLWYNKTQKNGLLGCENRCLYMCVLIVDDFLWDHKQQELAVKFYVLNF